jgi:hypothetical protein
MKGNRTVFTIVGIVIGLMMPAQMAIADTGTEPHGLLPVLTAEWWQWALSIPTPQNPLLDATGEDCMIGQRGSVWFLAGFLGNGGAVTRTCSVPDNTMLFFPVINQVWFNTPGKCGNPSQNLTVKELRKLSKNTIDQAHDLSVKVDEKPLEKNRLQRIQSQVFEFAFPSDNLCGDLPEGIYSPSVDDGYYVILEPLKRGNHTIHIGAQGADKLIEDITYNLNVEPVLLK